MPPASENARTNRPEFFFVGTHPAIDFANTLVPPPGPGIEFSACLAGCDRLARPDEAVKGLTFGSARDTQVGGAQDCGGASPSLERRTGIAYRWRQGQR